MKKDISVLGKGKSDPYAIINVGAQEFRTQIIDNNVNPKWDYWCEVRLLIAMKLQTHCLLFCSLLLPLIAACYKTRHTHTYTK